MKFRCKTLFLLIMSVLFMCAFSFATSAYRITYITEKGGTEFIPSDYDSIKNSYVDENGVEVFMLTAEKPVKEGYIFLGWNIEGVSDVIFGNRKIRADKNLRLIGQYSLGTCKIKYENTYKDEFEDEVTTGRDYRVLEPGCYYGRTFNKYEMWTYDKSKYLGTVSPKSIISVTRNITLKAIWNPYGNIFAEKIYFQVNISLQQSDILDIGNPKLPKAIQPKTIISCDYTNDSNKAITDIRFFEGNTYEGKTSYVFNGKTYTFVTMRDSSTPYNIRSRSGYSGDPLYLGYTCDSSNPEKIMGHTIMSKTYLTRVDYTNHAYHNIVREATALGREKNILYGTKYNGSSSFGGRENYIVFDKYDPTKFIADFDVYTTDDVYSNNWMKKIPDDYYVTEINIPGSHDTCAVNAYQPAANPCTQTQYQPMYKQLNDGCRLVDIRIDYDKDSKELLVVHGPSHLDYNVKGKEKTDKSSKEIDDELGRSRDKFSKLRFADALYWAVKFVTENPSETILFSIQSEKPYSQPGVDIVRSSLQLAMHGYQRNGDNSIKYFEAEPGRIWIENRIPTMREARGKVIILNSWWSSEVPYKNISYGIDFGDYGTPRSSYYYPFLSEGGSKAEDKVISDNINPYFNAVEYGGSVFLSNNQRVNIASKYIWNLSRVKDIKRQFYYINTQCRKFAPGWPRSHYEPIHNHINSHNFIPGAYYGLIAFDFFNSTVSSTVYNTNLPYSYDEINN